MARFGQSPWRRFKLEIGARPLGPQSWKWIMIFLSAVWIAGAGWYEISGATSNYGFTSGSYRKAIKACRGSFANRYECKSSAIISGENQAFIDWTVRLAIIFVPPLGLGMVYGALRRRREERDAEEARRHFHARRRQSLEETRTV